MSEASKPHSMRYPEGPGVLRELLKEPAEGIVQAIVEDPSLLLYVEDLLEQLEVLRETLEQIAGPTPTSHRKTIDQLTDAVKWRQGMARDALARLDSNPAKKSLPCRPEANSTHCRYCGAAPMYQQADCPARSPASRSAD